jgi:hypothetical protein
MLVVEEVVVTWTNARYKVIILVDEWARQIQISLGKQYNGVKIKCFDEDDESMC